MGDIREWARSDAERRIGELLDSAKNGQLQEIKDVDGVIEVRFVKSKSVSATKFLSQGRKDDI